MNLIFDKKTLKVITILDSNLKQNNNNILKCMFPKQFENLSLWEISNLKDHLNLLYLRVELDKYDMPDKLFFKNKLIYQCSVEEKKKRENGRKKIDNKNILKINGITLKRELLDFLISSPYTKARVAKDLSQGNIPFQIPIVVIWKGFFKLSTGYSAIGRNILFRLHNYGIFAIPEHLPSHSDIDPTYLKYLSLYDTMMPSNFRRHYMKIKTKILSHTPLADNFNGRKIIYTMMETETLHPNFVNMCNQYNEVWVPCRHNQELFTKYGVRVPIYVIPLGVDERFYFQDNTVPLNIESGLLPLLGNGLKSFKFISLFQWYIRKRPDILIKSFVKGFTEKDDVCLIIVNHYGNPTDIFKEVQQYARTIRQSNFPSIFLYNQIPTDAQLPNIYKFCNAFVSTSMGEGFSLPHIEAAACGLPVISSYHTAMKDYLNHNNAYLVTPSNKEICSPQLATACGWYEGQLFNSIDDKEMELFSIQMKNVVENYKQATEKALRLKELVKNNYTWDITTSMVARRIRIG